MIKARLTTSGSGGVIILSSSNTQYQIALTSTDDNGFITGPISVSGSDIVVNQATDLDIYASINFEYNNNPSQCTLRLGIKINGVIRKESTSTFTENDPISMDVRTLERLNPGDRISVYVSTDRGSPYLYVNKDRMYTYLSLIS